MNNNRYYVYKKAIRILTLLFISTALFSCGSTNDERSSELEIDDEFYLSRPKIIVESPISRLPYTLKWEENRLVRSYEIQMAFDQKFTDSRQNWTTKEPFLILDNIKSETVYIRIRSHYAGESSRWSEILELSLSDEELQIKHVRN